MTTMHDSVAAREAIEKYLKFEISAAALRSALGAAYSFERNGSNFSLTGGAATDEPVAVGVDGVLRAIDLALRGSVPLDGLQEWANFILLSDECEIAPYLGDATRQRLTTLIHNLASPEILGELTRQRLQQMRSDLAALSLE